MMNIHQVFDLAPTTPACFHSRTQWTEYLLSAQRYSKAPVLPFSGGEYQAGFNFCKDCTRHHKTEMQAVGQCQPEQFRIKEVA